MMKSRCCYEKCVLLLSLITFLYANGCPGQTDAEKTLLRTVKYHGIRPTDPNGTKGLRNPERGFRLELVAGEIEKGATYYPGNKVICLPLTLQKQLTGKEPNDELWVKCFKYYSDHGLTLALAYCYLTDYYNTEIPQTKLDALQKTFDHFRKNGYKIIPLFLYEYTLPAPFGPSASKILEDLDRLESIIKQNADIIYAMRAGFVGAYGEWHSSYNKLEQDHQALSQIEKKLLRILPNDRMACIRVPKYKRWVLGQSDLGQYKLLDESEKYNKSFKARIGYADDGFMASHNGIMTDGGTWPEPPHYASKENPEFDMMTQESPYLVVTGEMFIQDAGGRIDGYAVAKRLRLHHYSAFSFFHGNNEMELYGGDNNPPPFNINRWMINAISKADLIKDSMPISDGYFEDDSGSDFTRTQFEYIRDHLGYRFELQQASFPSQLKIGEILEVDIELINRGFSTTHNPRTVYIVLIDEKGLVHEFLTSANPINWQPFQPGDEDYKPLTHKFGIKAKLPENFKDGCYKVGLWMPDAYQNLRMNSHYAVRVANRDVPWWTGPRSEYGINLLGVMVLNN